jgi:photosystem II stability/assembly factor-like uncharacterized protein
MEAMRFWNDSRSYPGDALPEEGFAKAFKNVKANKDLNKINTDNKWEEIGPHNIGGRTISIALNPQNPRTVYAGSASGGLWRSYSGGEGVDAWEYVPTGFPVLGVSYIEFEKSDSNVIYIGTGEVYNYEETRGGVAIRETRGSYGIGILKTTDGGNTWEKSLDWDYKQGTGVWVIKLNPLNSRTVWAGTTEGTFKSTDSGETWIKINSTIMVTDLIINPVDTNNVLIACGNLESTGHGIYRTENSGSTWHKVVVGLPSTYGGKALFGTYKEDPNILYLSIGNGYWSNAGTWLCKSTNGGVTWSVQSTFDYSTYQGWFAHFVVVHQENPESILTAGVDVFKSVDGGVTQSRRSYWYSWDFGRPPAGGPEGPSTYSHADHHAYVIHPDDPDIVYLANDGGIFRTKDFGLTFEGLNGGYQTTQFYNGFVSSITDSNFSIGGMQDNATAIYDGTKEWVRVIGGDGGWAAINQDDNRISFGSWQNGNLRRLIRQSFGIYQEEGIASPGGGQAAFIAPYVINEFNPNVMYLGRTIVHKSTDGGNNWTATNGGSALTDNLPISIESSTTDENLVFVGTAPTSSTAEIFRTTNGGDSWENVIGDLPDRYVTDIAIDPDDDNNVYVVFSGFGSSHAFRSIDKGDSWINIGDGLPDVPTSSIVVDPFNSQHIYVGNDLGVFFSSDNGENWILLNEGLPDACMVSNLSVSNSNKKLRVATHGNGAFERDLMSTLTSVTNESNNILDNFVLEQNYPNPFNPTTTISYSLPELKGRVHEVELIILDMLGREINTLVKESQGPGSYSVEWNASGFSSGLYFYKLNFGSQQITKKMLLIK